MNSRFLACSAAIALLCSSAGPCFAINLVLDYTYDDYFKTHATAKATLERAALDISNAITTNLGATTDTNSGTSGITTITLDYNLAFLNPADGMTNVPFDPVVLPANQIRVYVGMHALDLGTLGEGGPGAGAFSRSGFSANNNNDVSAAIHSAASAGSANMSRGGGPVLEHKTASILNYPDTSFTINFGAMVGHLWFNSDTNDDQVKDTDAQLNNYYQLDYTQPPAGKNDLYTVALHELLHVVGFGASETWTSHITGTHSWTGSQVAALLGSGTGVLAADDKHVADGLLSTRISDGGTQEALMDPNITTGTRKSLTRLDLAFLRDIGWQTIANPLLPGDFNFDNLRNKADIAAMLKALTNLNKFASDHALTQAQLLTLGNLNGDSKVSNADIQSLLNLISNSGGGSVEVVPEPASLLLLAVATVGLAILSRAQSKRAN